MTARPDRLALRRARLYESIRTAHLERAHELSPASIVFQEKRYDFDDGLVAGLDLVQASPLRAARLVANSPLELLEVNEPLMLSSLPTTVLALLGVSSRRMSGRSVPRVVTYAIGNADPFLQIGSAGWKTRVRRRLERRLARFAWHRIDEIVYGTDAARRTYESLLPARRSPTGTTIAALPERCPTCSLEKVVGRVVFLGALSQRKGFHLVADAWPLVVAANPEATLHILGKGPLQSRAEELAASEASVELLVDPPRTTIHRELSEASVLALPSQASPTWREQVGLPIVEGLAHGCSIVATTETGLASWLVQNGHSAIDPSGGPEVLAAAIIEQLRAARSVVSIVATLPDRDGRLAADEYLTRGL